MKVIRSVKCSLKYLSTQKRAILEKVREEYVKVANLYIEFFWVTPLVRSELKGDVLNMFVGETWFGQRMLQNVAREALDMIKAALLKAEEEEEAPVMPRIAYVEYANEFWNNRLIIRELERLSIEH